MRFPVIPPHLAHSGCEHIKRDFLTAWATTDSLFDSLLSEEVFLRAPHHGLRHPLVFYFAHSAVFFINKLIAAGLLKDPIEEEFERHFAIRVDEHSRDDMSKNHSPEDSFAPLAGFRPHPLYTDYSIPSFDRKHRLILGGSFISTGEQASPWVRSNFREHFFQHAGIRLVRPKST